MRYNSKTSNNRLKMAFVLCVFVLGAFHIRIFAEPSPDLNKESGIHTSASPTPIERIRERLPALFTEGVTEVHCIEDVIKNDGKRRGNLRAACADGLERSKVIVEYVNILRPKNENDVLYEYIQYLEDMETDKESLYEKLSRFFTFMKRFCTDDIRLYTFAKESIEDNASSASATHMIGSALRFMGMCRVPEVTGYFSTAVTEEYWKKIAKIESEESNRNFTVHLNAIRHGVVFAITNLPADDALPILEQLWKKLTPKDYIYEVTWRALDEIWRRKKGDPPLFDYATRYEYDDPEARPSAYPEWIYGVGGVKIEWPFGQPPAGYTPPRVHMDFF